MDELPSAKKKSKCSRKTVCISVLVLLLLVGGLAGFLTYWFTRPENLEVTTAQADEQSPLALLQASENGTVRIDSSYLLADPSNLTYHLTIDNETLSSLEDEALYLVSDLGAINYEDTSDNFILYNISSLEFPHPLPSSFDPSLYEGGVLVSTADLVVRDTFDWIIDLTPPVTAAEVEDMESSTTAMMMTTTVGESQQSTVKPTTTAASTTALANDVIGSNSTLPTTPEDESITAAGTAPTLPPTAKPPVQSATKSPTQSPTKSPVAQESPIVLYSELSGEYNVEGSILLQYRTDLDSNGYIINRPFLLFQNITAPSAPGPFLWMTRRANQRHRQILDQDIYIAFEDRPDGSFTKSGTYTIDFPEPNVDFSEFVGGSYIVWCAPFTVWIGGGDIVEVKS